MTQYFVRKTCDARLNDGSHYTLVRGIREVPDDLADSPEGHKLGVVALNEMTDQERADFGLPLVLDVDPDKVKQVPAQSTTVDKTQVN